MECSFDQWNCADHQLLANLGSCFSDVPTMIQAGEDLGNI